MLYRVTISRESKEFPTLGEYLVIAFSGSIAGDFALAHAKNIYPDYKGAYISACVPIDGEFIGDANGDFDAPQLNTAEVTACFAGVNWKKQLFSVDGHTLKADGEEFFYNAAPIDAAIKKLNALMANAKIDGKKIKLR